MKSIIRHLGTDQFKRIKIGIDRPSGNLSVPDYVLSPFRQEELETVLDAVDRAKEAVNEWVKSDFLQAMNQFNVRK